MATGFHLVESATIYPARCPCGSVQGPLVDTSFMLAAGQGSGYRIYICSRCAAQAATLLGWTSPEDASVKDSQLDQFATRIRSLEAQLAEELAKPVVQMVDPAAVIDEMLERASQVA